MEVELRDWDQQVAVIKLHCVAKRLEKRKKCEVIKSIYRLAWCIKLCTKDVDAVVEIR